MFAKLAVSNLEAPTLWELFLTILTSGKEHDALQILNCFYRLQFKKKGRKIGTTTLYIKTHETKQLLPRSEELTSFKHS